MQAKKRIAAPYNTYNKKADQKKKYVEVKPVQIKKPPLIGSTQYLPFLMEDSLYLTNLHPLTCPTFQMVLQKNIRDLNILLHFNHDDFWAEIEMSDSLKICLESCLNIFPRKIYSQYVTKDMNYDKTEEVNKNEFFILWSELMRIVLFIYHRIACQSRQAEQQIIYDDWLLDIPKFFHLIDTYGTSNRLIVQNILKTVFKNIPKYETDMRDFIKIFETTILNAIHSDLMFEFEPAKLQKCKNFNNSLKSFTRNLIKSFFRIFDAYHTIYEFLSYFPKSVCTAFITDELIQLELLDFYFMFMENIRSRWQIDGELLMKLRQFIEKVRQTMINYFITFFDMLDFQLRNSEGTIRKQAVRTYTQICNHFEHREDGDHQKLWEQLIKILIKQINNRPFFTLSQNIANLLSESEKACIEECLKFQDDYRQEISKDAFNLEQVLELKLEHIPSYQDWIALEQYDSFNAFDEDDENYLDFGFNDESMFQAMNKGVNRQSKINSPPKAPKQNYKQYDDQPEEDEIISYMGLEPIEQQWNDIEIPSAQNMPSNLTYNTFQDMSSLTKIDASLSDLLSEKNDEEAKQASCASYLSQIPEMNSSQLEDGSFSKKQERNSFAKKQFQSFNASFSRSACVDASINASFTQSFVSIEEQSKEQNERDRMKKNQGFKMKNKTPNSKKKSNMNMKKSGEDVNLNKKETKETKEKAKYVEKEEINQKQSNKKNYKLKE